ncbi:MAG: Smr/MutS family protein, partial [Chloroflexota bacterium]
DRIVGAMRDEVTAARARLEREALTAPTLDRLVAVVDDLLAQLPVSDEPAAEPAVIGPVAWRVGMRARSRSRGWEGRLAALDRGGRRATLEVGGLRVTAEVDDLVPAMSAGDEARPARGLRPGEESSGSIPALRLERARTVASSLDMRGARVDEALELLGRYLDDASLAGLPRATIVHGLGTGALRDAVRGQLAGHPLVRSWRPGGRGEGGDGATVVEL